MSNRHDVAVLGVGMHPWGKWGRNFVEYGVDAAQAALADSGLQWSDVGFVAGADTIRRVAWFWISASQPAHSSIRAMSSRVGDGRANRPDATGRASLASSGAYP